MWRLFTGQTHTTLAPSTSIAYSPFFIPYFCRCFFSFWIKITLCVCIWYVSLLVWRFSLSALTATCEIGRFGVIVSICTGGNWNPYVSGVLLGSYQAGQSFGPGLSLRPTPAVRAVWTALFAHAVIHLLVFFFKYLIYAKSDVDSKQPFSIECSLEFLEFPLYTLCQIMQVLPLTHFLLKGKVKRASLLFLQGLIF